MVFRHPANLGFATTPPVPPRLAELDVLVIGVVELADGRPTLQRDLPDLSRRQHDGRPAAFLVAQPGAGAGRTAQSAALAGLELDAVHGQARGDVLQRHAVARLGLDGCGRAENDLAVGDIPRREDVSPGAILVLEQRDMARPVGVVLDPDDGGGHVVLVATEVDEPVPPLVPTAASAHGDLALVVPPPPLRQGAE